MVEEGLKRWKITYVIFERSQKEKHVFVCHLVTNISLRAGLESTWQMFNKVDSNKSRILSNADINGGVFYVNVASAVSQKSIHK